MSLFERAPKEANKSGESILGQQVVEGILRDAKKILLEEGHVAPMLFLGLGNGERALTPLDLPETHAERAAYFSAIGSGIQRSGRNLSEAVFVSETWFVSSKKDGKITPNIKPSEHPDRKEAIVIVGRNAERTRQSFVIQPFSRDIELMPIFEELDVAEYDKPPNEKGLRATGLIDNLFARPIR